MKFLAAALALVFSVNALAVTKVKPLKIGADGLATELGTSDYLGVKGVAFDNLDATLIDVGSSRVQVTHNSVTGQVCQQASDLTTASIPFSDSSGRLTQDNSNFNFDDSNNVLNVPKIQNGSTSSSNFTIAANSNAFAAGNTGRIVFKERGSFTESFSVSSTFVDNWLTFQPTITSTTALTAMTGVLGAPTIRYNTAQLLSSAPAFSAVPTYQPTTTSSDTGFFSGFSSGPIFKPDISSGTATSALLWGYIASPKCAINNAGSAVVTSLSSYTSYGDEFFNDDIGASCTVTTLNHYNVVNPSVNASGAITNQNGLNLPSTMTSGTVKGINSAISANASRWFLYSSGTAVSNLTGGLRIGDTTQPTQKLEVLGNALIDNGGTAGELRFREPSGSGSNYTAFKAQAQSGDITYTLPAADGSSGNVLSTNGSGTLSWTAPSGGTVLNAFKTSDLSRNSTTTIAADSDLTISTTWAANSTYSVEGMIFTSAANATPDLEFQFNGPTVNFVTLGYLAMRAGSTSVVTAANDTAFATGGSTGTIVDLNLTTRHYIIIHGSFQTTGTPGSTALTFEWAQSTSNGSNVTIHAGSWIRVTKMN